MPGTSAASGCAKNGDLSSIDLLVHLATICPSFLAPFFPVFLIFSLLAPFPPASPKTLPFTKRSVSVGVIESLFPRDILVIGSPVGSAAPVLLGGSLVITLSRPSLLSRAFEIFSRMTWRGGGVLVSFCFRLAAVPFSTSSCRRAEGESSGEEGGEDMIVFVLGVAVRNEGAGGEDKRIMGSVLAFNRAMVRIESARWAYLRGRDAKVNFTAVAVKSDVNRGSRAPTVIARAVDG